MNLEIIRRLSEKRSGGLKKLATDVGMSEQNLHRCIRNNKIQADDLEQIAILLGVDIRIFFDGYTEADEAKICDSHNQPVNTQLLELCKSLVANYQQRDIVMNKLVSMVKCME
jgi:DNA-binding Xre family transcriptional regulator